MTGRLQNLLALVLLSFVFYSFTSAATLSQLLGECNWKAKISDGYLPVNDSVVEVQDTLKYFYTQYGSQGRDIFCPLVDVYSRMLKYLFGWRRCFNGDPFCTMVMQTVPDSMPWCTPYLCYKKPKSKCRTTDRQLGTCTSTVCPFVCFYFPKGPLTAAQAAAAQRAGDKMIAQWKLTKKRTLNRHTSRLRILVDALQKNKRGDDLNEAGNERRQNLSTSCPYCGCLKGDVPCTSCAVEPWGTPCWHNSKCCQCVGLF
eukprot:TRINITY_DN4379_c0_g1_i1.p1 TRINITY_DN4379_c0_g1~~TRINITY_DN4379_c0_g1_i1.p1  ORF type:complete len:257 (-),score=25.07 TRINITY_DN4379_c0_g1_i1:52-822(-)